MKKSYLVNLLATCLLFSSLLTHANEEKNKAVEVTNKVKVEETSTSNESIPTSAYFQKLASEKESGFNPYVLTPHKMTYLLPLSVSDNMNREVYDGIGQWGEDIQSFEAKFQFSVKVPLTKDDLFTSGDSFYFGFTLQSWWQLYNQELSRPFRETNYQPELFYTAPLSWQPLGGQTNMVIGFEHQSNGRTQMLSRSWNRLYYTFTFAKDNYAVSLRPWWKIPEGSKETTPTESGNDNIDISDYMGHFDLTVLYQWESVEFSFVGRQNFKTHNGGMELGITFPLSGKLKGYFQYTKGYGESLIDYNHSQQTFGIGIALTEMF
ncbi:phospholipase A [Colwellia sp. 12G3]|uniref:phospholipase A n=1 Tax=Colwellia sp. 12G3 TaxID=2058299 RepID=UPI000C33F674|nr:phospholipase A [Colwellia sp. 12G3]PKI17265.1 phospholipase [Colwellia sp. 12G3]